MRRRLLLVAFAAVALAGLAGLWVIFGPNTRAYEGARGVKIPPGSSFEAVVDSLAAADIVASRATLRLLGTVTGWGGQVKAGHYAFKSGVSNYRMLDRIRKGLQTPVRLMIPPGSHAATIAAVAAREMAFPADSMRRALADTALARSLGVGPGHLVGYMLPETYSFYWLTDAPTVVRKVKQAFDTFYAREIAPGAATLGFNENQVVTLASIVEWETARDDERARVAGVYLNRLRIGMPLQADPTVQYLVMRQEGRKRRLFLRDLQTPDPYNTYRVAGLPPGPITNPSPASLRATVAPERHDYLYFVARGDGSHVFSRTFDEHRLAAGEYRALMEARRREQAAAPAP